jgi:ribosomal protein L37E
MQIRLPTLECLRCGHKWHPKKEEMPERCGFCKTPYWRKAAGNPSGAKGKHIMGCKSCKEPENIDM